jgi:DNA (cytosine-5)-methyltransferase 1
MLHGMALCAGAGGLELGLRIALGDDYRCVVYVEREAYAAATLVARMADQALDQAPVWDDLSTFDGSGWRGVVDLMSAGFSCQPWSPAGKRLGIEDERWLWPDIDRVVREVGPEWVFLENVPGLVRGGLEHVLRDLAAQGFDAEWDCVSASEVGAPQLRERLYILAHRNPPGQCLERRQSEYHQYAWDHADGHSRPSAALDDTNAGRRRRTDNEVRPGRDCPGRTGAVGDAQHAGCQWLSPAADGRSNPTEPWCQPEGSRKRLGDTASRGLRVGWRTRADVLDESDSAYWPPDRRFRGVWPSGFEPAVRRVADGMAPWVDRLRLTGNGVVPLAAAVAFLRLRDRLCTGGCE